MLKNLLAVSAVMLLSATSGMAQSAAMKACASDVNHNAQAHSRATDASRRVSSRILTTSQHPVRLFW